MTTRTLLLLCLVAACDKKSTADQPKPADKPAPVATTVEKPAAGPDAACAAKLKAFEPWLGALELEQKSYEIEMGYHLPVLDRAPVPVPQKVDAVEIVKSGIRAWDVSEHDHAQSALPEKPSPKQLADYLAKMKGMAAGADEFHPAPDDLLRLDVDKDATWGDVVRVLDAATKAGYARAVFAFTATSKLEQPPGVDAQTKTEAAQKAASDRIEALQSTCKPWGSAVLGHTPDKDPAADAAAWTKEIVAALGKCNCAADPDELRKQMWTDARWHQAIPRVGVTIVLGDDKATAVALPAKTPWSEASAKLAAAVPGSDPAAVKLVAK